MSMSPEHARLMMEKAAEDEYVLAKLAGDPEAPDAAIGFHAQQAVEKMLKAVLTARAIRYGRTHDLDFLVELLRQHSVELPPEPERLTSLVPYAAEFRYDRLPPETVLSDRVDRDCALAIVCQVKGWAERMLRT